MRRNWIWLTTVLVAAVAAVTLWPRPDHPITDGELPRVHRGDLVIEVPAAGSLVAGRSVDVTAPISSDPHFFKVARIVPEGTRVAAGQTIMELDSQEVAQRLLDYQAEVRKTEEERSKRTLEYDLLLRDLRVRIEQARVRSETAALKSAVDPDVIPQQDLRQLQLEAEQATREHTLLHEKLVATEQMMKAELAVLDKNLANVRLRLAQAQTLREACTVKAPIAGTLVYKVMADGAKRKVGEQTCHHEIILQIPDLSTLRLHATVDEAYASRVQKGQRARIRVDAMADASLAGTIVEAGTVLHTKRESPVKVIDIVIDLDRTSGHLSPGMTATAQIEVERVAGALLAPVGSVYERDGTVFARVHTAHGRIEERPVRTGRRNQELVEIIEGMAEGERLARVDRTRQ